MSMNFDIKNHAEPALDVAELANFGLGQVAYVKPVEADEVARLFPQAPKLQPGMRLFALLSASGEPILLTDNHDVAIANAWAHDLTMVSLH
jgi:hypothetical protein